uniref:Uncharacterized protein n=1 Tax=Parascaris equorum TaxID=6256 RepID=A0A914RTZ4_PAREQ
MQFPVYKRSDLLREWGLVIAVLNLYLPYFTPVLCYLSIFT